jgi:uncharacterized membrane protein YkoI
MMHLTRWILSPVGLGAAVISSSCNHRTGTSIKEESPGLTAQAKVYPATARRTALAKVPRGRIVQEEIEQEDGKLVYSFDMKKGTESGVEEVRVDALNGSVVSVEHEDPAKEAAEAKQEKGAHP